MTCILSSIPKKIKLLVPGLLTASITMAQDPKIPSSMENPLAQIMILIIILLVVAIGILAHVVNGAASVYRDKMREEKSKNNKAIMVLIPVMLMLSVSAIAQGAPAVNATTFNGLSAGSFYALIAVIFLELLVIIVLTYQLKWLIGIHAKKKAVVVAIQGEPKLSWWDKLNKSIAIEKEKDIDLNHDYDGIRELDNPIPPWWMAAFLFFIIFGFGYLWRYHVAKSAPLQLEELKISMERAEIEKAAYLAKSANLIDETNVTMMDEAAVAAGRSLFAANCVACHGPEGQGASVGPNLSDTYWLHGGSISDVFKTIKYGWPDKGMRSWKEDFSPMQLAQLASYVRSLQGSNPPNPKEPQGELYAESTDAATPDSISTAPSVAK